MTNDILIASIGYVNDLNKLQQFKVKKGKGKVIPLQAQCGPECG